jgi:capsular exopolysaccharide synthesis family protein
MNLVTLTDPQSKVAEAYRSLRTNLHFAMLEAPLRTLLVVAPNPSNGAALVVANLAVTLAQIGRRVIAVDADFYTPALHEAFNAPSVPGLADWLADLTATSQPPLQATALPDLRLLASGTRPAIPADVISSDRMTHAIARLGEMADLVLFSAPSLSTHSEAGILASRMDGALLVVEAGKTRRDSAQKARDILTRARARILGVVMLSQS